MGYRGKVEEQEQARLLRAEGRTLLEIAETLGVSKSSVSLWVRDMGIEVRQRKVVARRRPIVSTSPSSLKSSGSTACGRDRIGVLSDEAFLAAGAALYAGEGAKRDGR